MERLVNEKNPTYDGNLEEEVIAPVNNTFPVFTDYKSDD